MSGRRSIVGPRPGEIAEIDRELIIGREGDVTIDDPEVSRRHAAVRPVPEGVELEDLGSANGTFVDGGRIAGRTTLTESATVRVGASELRIEIALPRQRTQLIGASVGILAIAAVVVILLLGGSSSTKT